MVQVNDAVIAESDVIDLRRFLSELRTKLLESKTDKALIRMIFDSLQAFGPGATGSNLLINRFIKKEESILFRIERLLNNQQQRNLEESKVPQAALSLAAANSTENKVNEKREEEEMKRQSHLEEVCSTFNVVRAEIFNGLLNGFNQATSSGPLCEEPMQGACFIIQNIELVKEEQEESKAA